MQSHNGLTDTTHTPPPLSFYNTFNNGRLAKRVADLLLVIVVIIFFRGAAP
jgi:hypothetical protein